MKVYQLLPSLVPKVSHLTAHWGQYDKRPWERGWLPLYLNCTSTSPGTCMYVHVQCLMLANNTFSAWTTVLGNPSRRKPLAHSGLLRLSSMSSTTRASLTSWKIAKMGNKTIWCYNGMISKPCLNSGLLTLCKGVILHNWPQITFNWTIHEKWNNSPQNRQFNIINH